MKILLVFELVFLSFSVTEACHGCVESTERDLDTRPAKRVALSDMRQMRCIKDFLSPNPDSFEMKIVEDGVPYNCDTIGSTDADFDNTINYPVAPSKPEGVPQSFSYTRLDSANAMIVNCIEPGSNMDEIIFSTSKGYFPVVDVKEDKKYLCIRLAIKAQGFSERVAKAFSYSC